MRLALAAALSLSGVLGAMACGRSPCNSGNIETSDHWCVLPITCPEGSQPSLHHERCELPDGGIVVPGSSGEAAGTGMMTGTIGRAADGGIRSSAAGSSGRNSGGAPAADGGKHLDPEDADAGSPTSPSSSGTKGPRCGDGVLEAGEKCDGNCPTACPAQAGCSVSELKGSAASCTAECVTTTITVTKAGDGCCPEGANAGTDSDCPMNCGDGIVQPPEICEPTSKDKPCPTSCDDGDPCTEDMLTGSASQCNVVCVRAPITAAKSGDMCCPRGANETTDSDCKPVCGNGVVESGELCDGNCPTHCAGDSGCDHEILVGSAAQCNAMCTEMKITVATDGDMCCPRGANETTDSDCKPVCGNGVVESGELCDGNCPTSCGGGNDSCTTKTLMGSAARCNAECRETTTGTARTYYQDCDGDGYAASSTGMSACSKPPEVGGCAWIERAPVAATTDCDDMNAARHPGADFGLPISRAGQQLPPAGDQAYDLDCDGVLTKGSASTLSTGQIKQGKLEMIELCGSTSSCSPGGPVCATSFPVPGGGAVCGEAYVTQPICGGGDINVYFLCR